MKNTVKPFIWEDITELKRAHWEHWKLGQALHSYSQRVLLLIHEASTVMTSKWEPCAHRNAVHGKRDMKIQ